MTRRHYTPEEDAILRRLYPDTPTPKLAEFLGRTDASVFARAGMLGLHKSLEFMRSYHAARLTTAFSGPTRFKPGERPWNKGVAYQAGGRSKETQFKPRQRPHTWRPVGSYGLMDGYLRVKVSDESGTAADWRLVHHLAWEAAHGPAPAGMVIAFRPGMHTTDEAQITAERLELVTRAELMRRNSCHRHGKELAYLSQLRGAITRQINRRERATEAT